MSDGSPWNFTPREVLEPLKQSIRRVATLPAPLVNTRTPQLAAVLPIELEDGPWLGNYIWDVLQNKDTTLENYIPRPEVRSILEYLINLQIHPAAGMGGPWKYTPRPHDMQVSLHLRKRVPKGVDLSMDDKQALIREKKIELNVILYY